MVAIICSVIFFIVGGGIGLALGFSWGVKTTVKSGITKIVNGAADSLVNGIKEKLK